jgi:protoporphyrinogen oxidase
LKCQENRITHVQVIDESSGRTSTIEADYVISTMPVKELIRALGHAVPNEISAIAQGLIYRDFITLGLLVEKLAIKNETDIKTMHNIIPDNWIYIQDRDVKLGRLQIFNNWSPYMVKDLSKVWMGLEYFCNEGDHLWGKSDREFTRFGLNELMKIGFIEKKADVLDSIVVRVRKAYPVYHGTYKSFDTVRQFVDRIPNLFLVGRNGMHRYNNQDHSMLTAMTAVENICKGTAEKENIWLVNTERQYHEGK